MEKRFRGLHTALITPFTENGDVDVWALQQIIEHQIEAGVDGLVPCGTTGESPTLSHQEHDHVIELTVKFAEGRVPVIAGTGSNSTSEAVRLSQHAEASGADAVLLVNPYYNKPTQKGLYHHFKAIADAVSIPCILYNIKGRTAVNMETETAIRLMNDCRNIIAVKEASGDLNQMKSVIAGRNDQFLVLSGDDNMTVKLIEAGGDGVISVAANLVPEHMRTMVHAALDGDLKTAKEMEAKLTPLFKACFIETNPIPIKTAMAYSGWCQEKFRLPMCSLSTEEHREAVIASLDGLDIKKREK
ncbi:MAG: 4-hydroxy-tetrahydrodipicolinate synthase [Spirochaetia bacterium]|nr:4-hydroxy-tetrahydrodipicolinate synthase [Spirochaetia bacterium]